MKPLKPRTFLSSQFFILSLAFSVFFDPIGISYFLLGVVWMFSKRLAYFEVLAIFVLKGEYGFLFLAPSIEHFYSSLTIPAFSIIIKAIVPPEIILGFLYGSILAVQISGKLVRNQIRRKAPDLLGMIR